MKRSSVFLVILLLVVVAAAVLSVLLFFGGGAKDPEPTQQIHTPAPVTAAPDPTETPAETPTPVPTPTPEPTEPPVFETRPPITEPPQETEEPSGASLSGSARSNTGTGLNMVVAWSADAAPGAETGTLTVRVSAESYSFFTSALYDAVELTVNGRTYKTSSADVSYSGTDLVTSPIASFTVEVPRGSVSYSVVWHYKGSYSGVELEDITASGSFNLDS